MVENPKVYATIPQRHKDIIDQLVDDGTYKDTSDCVRNIIREWIEMKETERARVKRNLTK